jgi:hypothetical protein
MFAMPRLLLALLLAYPLLAADHLLFTSFRRNGETGVYFALSDNGRRWTPLNENQPWIKPEHPGMLMRDPFLARGPDGVWRLLWTWGWTRKETGGVLKIGYSSSRDLLQWTPQKEIPLMPGEPEARNAWAPEAVWDPERGEWIVFWATTISGRFPETEKTGDGGYNHRIYAITTRDWNTFSPARLWFDPGFNCIDSTIVQTGSRWVMVFKDERREPLQKRLRLAFSSSAAGPWRDITEPFTRDWVEGPSVARVGSEWWIYFDHYTKPRHYGAVRTRDWKLFEDVSGELSFPEDHRHGTVVAIPADTARRLKSQRR